MPVMDGWQFRAEQGRDPALADIPVVLLSADTGLARTAAALGAAGYLQKPTNLDDLFRTVRRQLPADVGSSPARSERLPRLPQMPRVQWA